MKNKILSLLIALCFSQIVSTVTAQEKVFAQYFDIPIGSPEGTEVIGRIHLERNKDVLTRPIPKGYRFEILEQDKDELFRLDTRYDLSKRIMGVLTVADGKRTDNQPASHRLTIALKDGNKLLNKFKINIKVTKKTLWSTLNERYTPGTLNIDRLYGRSKYSDDKVAAKIIELKRNNWKFEGLEKCYNGRPQDYVGEFDPTNDHLPTGTIEYDWKEVVNQIGGMGYAYATSNVYGPKEIGRAHV